MYLFNVHNCCNVKKCCLRNQTSNRLKDSPVADVIEAPGGLSDGLAGWSVTKLVVSRLVVQVGWSVGWLDRVMWSV